ncbi:MAG: hypothetical protein U0942_02080 [Parvibaculum sp.]|uniref:AbrB/MazE/SpoVT family DNA-binding domain-containing protein n=1 Tax=Parvibaculum sp. TaxID=2024848 RepID=UPI002ABA01E7|nr:hypothetical protein [Parvibaculum sp.]MDZ4380110.1 hypothetical protein [Parvibaculum sp.]
MLPSKEMERLTKGLPGPSAKIRALAAAGVRPADIARFLNIRYQHAYNVIKQSAASDGALPHGSGEDGETLKGQYVEVGPAGRVIIPPAFLAAISAKEGDRIFLKPIDGKLQIMSKTAALEEMRKLVRQYIPEGVNLADELIADRRREVAREAKGRG